jgi:hypothetical protein
MRRIGVGLARRLSPLQLWTRPFWGPVSIREWHEVQEGWRRYRQYQPSPHDDRAHRLAMRGEEARVMPVWMCVQDRFAYRGYGHR